MQYILAATKRRAFSKNNRRASYKTNLVFSSAMWILLGIIIGASLTSLVLFKLNGISLSVSPRAAIKAKFPANTLTSKPKKKQVKQPKFEFYKELTEQQVVDSHSEVKKQTNKVLDVGLKKPKPAPTIYTIQAGSFGQKSDAEKFKAELALKGFDATIEVVQLQTGQKWYRINVGTFKTQQELALQQKLLAEHNIDSSLVTTIAN